MEKEERKKTETNRKNAKPQKNTFERLKPL
jgi:hypothetical protein